MKYTKKIESLNNYFFNLFFKYKKKIFKRHIISIILYI